MSQEQFDCEVTSQLWKTNQGKTMSVYTKLNEAREKFHNLKLEKTGFNKFAGYKYFELGDFLIPALRVFREVGLCAVVSFDKETATMQIFDVDANAGSDFPDVTITSPMGSAALKGCHEVQNIGAVETYQRRYLWTAALEIVEHDALDATTSRPGKTDTLVTPARPSIDSLDLDEDTLKWLSELADSVKTLCFEGKAKAALEMINAAQLDADQRTGLDCYIVDSKVRAALKKAKELNKEAA